MFPYTQPIKTDHLKSNKTFHSNRNKSDILSNTSQAESESIKEKNLHVPAPVYQRWWSYGSRITEDPQAVQGSFPCQAWVCKAAGLGSVGMCWLCPLNPSLEERSQLWPALFAWISDKWRVQPQGAVVTSCLWPSFRVSSPQLLSYSILLLDPLTTSFTFLCWKIIQNTGYLSINTALRTPRRNFAHHTSRPEQ